MKVLKKLLIILFGIITATFILVILMYKISGINANSTGSSTREIFGTKLLSITDGNKFTDANAGDMAVFGPPDINTLKSGITVMYISENKEVLLGNVLGVRGNYFLLEKASVNEISLDSLYGIYSFRIPYLGYVTDFSDTFIGRIICIAAPIVIIIVLVSSILLDIIHNASRHRKRIMRRKQRRRERYMKEGLCGNSRAMV